MIQRGALDSKRDKQYSEACGQRNDSLAEPRLFNWCSFWTNVVEKSCVSQCVKACITDLLSFSSKTKVVTFVLNGRGICAVHSPHDGRNVKAASNVGFFHRWPRNVDCAQRINNVHATIGDFKVSLQLLGLFTTS